ncbi:MAG TPA: ABC transporter ATP-binding protein [Aggregatilineales bacterium]|nr:ABC transporter ATP-binding protein [Aggregatilineales bacterium]
MIFRRAQSAEPSAEFAVEVSNLERTFGEGEKAVRVLRGLDLTVRPGLLVALYGPSGSGKTTLLNLIGALDRPTAGTIWLFGKDITAMNDSARARLRRTQIGFVFQSYALIPTYTAFENIDIALRLPHLGFRERRQRGMSALEAVGLRAWADHVPDELSGGQRQRLAIARALALRPKLMLADEPTGGLDTRTARRTLLLFKGVARAQGTTFLIVSHDPLVAEHVDMAYDLHEGQLTLHESHVPVTEPPSTEPSPAEGETAH